MIKSMELVLWDGLTAGFTKENGTKDINTEGVDISKINHKSNRVAGKMENTLTESLYARSYTSLFLINYVQSP